MKPRQPLALSAVDPSPGPCVTFVKDTLADYFKQQDTIILNLTIFLVIRAIDHMLTFYEMHRNAKKKKKNHLNELDQLLPSVFLTAESCFKFSLQGYSIGEF